MTTKSSEKSSASIGDMAGVVWRTLSTKGPLSITNLVKATGSPRDSVMQAIGWLAREEKISIKKKGRSCTISLL